jgi:hypothetical protein
MADDGEVDFVSLDLDDAAAVSAISRTTGIAKGRVLELLVRKGIGRPASGAWERRFYRLVDETARRLSEEDDDEEMSA